MSGGVETATADMSCCANCGKAEVDDVNLKKCACNLVKYCSVDCQKNNQSQHKKSCQKRMIEIRDDRLFTQPEESNLGECPICCLPLQLDYNKWRLNSCCCKRICHGCSYANKMREIKEGLEQRCPFCREPMPKSHEEIDKNFMERAKANDPAALIQLGDKCDDEGDYERAFEYFTKAAAFGDAEAHYNLSIMYDKGNGVEKEEKREVYHLEEAAIGGHPSARYNLGCVEHSNGMHERAMKHFIIAAKLGHDGALDAVKQGFTQGIVRKEDYASALRGHQAAVDATKSAHREEAEKNLVLMGGFEYVQI